MMNKLLIAYLIWNFIVFCVYGIDKFKAKKGMWRISEKALMLCALLMGAAGAFIGMQVFRHKTKHNLFVFGVPACLIINIAVVIAILKFV